MQNDWSQYTTAGSNRLLADRYRLHQSLGKGSFGEVFYAEDIKFDPPKQVAVKLLHSQYINDSQIREDIKHEASTLARFNHPNILSVIDYDISQERAYIVTSLAEGGSLANKLRPDPMKPPVRLPLEEVARYLDQIADALDEAHSFGLIHRDIKPLNILIDRRGRPLLADFGLAAALTGSQSSVLVDTSASGTPLYMAPEQWNGQAGKASDIYALGVLLYQLITGQPPFQGNQAALAYQHLNTPVPALRERAPDLVYSPALDAVLAEAMAKEPRQRTRSATELARHFRAALEDKPKPPTVLRPADPTLPVIQPGSLPTRPLNNLPGGPGLGTGQDLGVNQNIYNAKPNTRLHPGNAPTGSSSDVVYQPISQPGQPGSQSGSQLSSQPFASNRNPYNQNQTPPVYPPVGWNSPPPVIAPARPNRLGLFIVAAVIAFLLIAGVVAFLVLNSNQPVVPPASTVQASNISPTVNTRPPLTTASLLTTQTASLTAVPVNTLPVTIAAPTTPPPTSAVPETTAPPVTTVLTTTAVPTTYAAPVTTAYPPVTTPPPASLKPLDIILSSSGTVVFTNHRAVAGDPANGNTIFVSKLNNGSFSNPVGVVPNGGDAVISPNGNYVAYHTNAYSPKDPKGLPTSTEVYVSPLNNFGQRFLIGNGVNPTWSPDGQRLIWVSEEQGCGGDDLIQVTLDFSQAGVIKTKAGSQSRLTCDGLRKRSPRWSAQSEIAFSLSSEKSSQTNMRIVKIPAISKDTINYIILATGLFPYWSPDGSQLVYATGKTDGTDAQIFQIDGTGKNNHPLTNSATQGWNYRPMWLPNGLILFSSNRDRAGQASTSLWVMNPDGTGQDRLPLGGNQDDDYSISGWLKP